MQFLQMKKLLFELEVFQKEKNLPGFEFPGEARLLAELKEGSIATTKSEHKIPYLSRLKSSLRGGVVFFLLAVLLSFSPSAQQLTRFSRLLLFFCAIWFFRQRAVYWLS
jgi:hypothetical protein